jgi:hypothetical protein
MICLLRSANIVWGDFKPQDMLIDKEDKVWLVDFGGGLTHGWVEREDGDQRRRLAGAGSIPDISAFGIESMME